MTVTSITNNNAPCLGDPFNQLFTFFTSPKGCLSKCFQNKFLYIMSSCVCSSSFIRVLYITEMLFFFHRIFFFTSSSGVSAYAVNLWTEKKIIFLFGARFINIFIFYLRLNNYFYFNVTGKKKFMVELIGGRGFKRTYEKVCFFFRFILTHFDNILR